MKFIEDVMVKLIVGEETFVETISPTYGNYHVVFEDNKDTGYIYILDTENKNKNFIKDALSIYNVIDVIDKNISSEIKFLWSEDGYICIFLINDYTHAIINYKEKYAFCRTGFPPSDKESIWSKNGHDWNEEIFNKLVK